MSSEKKWKKNPEKQLSLKIAFRLILMDFVIHSLHVIQQMKLEAGHGKTWFWGCLAWYSLKAPRDGSTYMFLHGYNDICMCMLWMRVDREGGSPQFKPHLRIVGETSSAPVSPPLSLVLLWSSLPAGLLGLSTSQHHGEPLSAPLLLRPGSSLLLGPGHQLSVRPGALRFPLRLCGRSLLQGGLAVCDPQHGEGVEEQSHHPQREGAVPAQLRQPDRPGGACSRRRLRGGPGFLPEDPEESRLCELLWDRKTGLTDYAPRLRGGAARVQQAHSV